MVFEFHGLADPQIAVVDIVGGEELQKPGPRATEHKVGERRAMRRHDDIGRLEKFGLPAEGNAPGLNNFETVARQHRHDGRLVGYPANGRAFA